MKRRTIFALIQMIMLTFIILLMWNLNNKIDVITGKAVVKSADKELAYAKDPFIGDKNAPVTIVEFSDFQCPFCKKFNIETLPLIKKSYIDKGKVRLIFKNFPLGFHEYAQIAAEASECANEQGKFWQYHDKIFERQEILSRENLMRWAAETGLDMEEFNACLESEAAGSEVKKDITEGIVNGVSGTPSFLINGKLVTGAQPFSVFDRMIESEL